MYLLFYVSYLYLSCIFILSMYLYVGCILFVLACISCISCTVVTVCILFVCKLLVFFTWFSWFTWFLPLLLVAGYSWLAVVIQISGCFFSTLSTFAYVSFTVSGSLCTFSILLSPGSTSGISCFFHGFLLIFFAYFFWVTYRVFLTCSTVYSSAFYFLHRFSLVLFCSTSVSSYLRTGLLPVH